MNQHNQEKPSPILMLAPIALVLLGYHYLFHSKLNADLKSKRTQETALAERSQNIQRDLAMSHGELHQAKDALAEANKQMQNAQSDLADAATAKSAVLAFVLGVNDPGGDHSTLGLSNTGADSPTPGNAPTSLIGQFASMLTSSIASGNDGQAGSGWGSVGGGGQCSHMNSLCSILDSRRLKRLKNSDPSSSGSSGLVATERAELGKLLDTKLPDISRYQIQLEGTFPDLIAALHDLDERLPAVSVLSVSLDPIDMETRRQVWKLEVGIRG
ncbi:MAG: hypothetical protein AAGD07_25685 [Planctomycetota bacterium]